MEDKPHGNTEQQKEAPDAGQPPPPSLPEEKERSNSSENGEEGSEAGSTQIPPKTRWERFKIWVWPMDFSDAVMLFLTAAIAFGTIVSAVAIFLQWREMVNGGEDTTAIKNAAQQQAEAAQQFVITAGLISGNINAAVGKLQEQADASVGANHAWMVPETYSQTVTPIYVTFRNAGKSPAVSVVGKVEYAMVREKVNVTHGKLSLHEGCAHLKHIEGETIDPLVAAGSTMKTDLPNLPQDWSKPLGVSGYKEILIHGCLWYQDTLTNQGRTTEFWLTATNARFVGNIHPYDPNDAWVHPEIYKGKIFIFK